MQLLRMIHLLELTFPNGQSAKAIYPDRTTNLSEVLQEAGLRSPRPTLVIIGGAKNMTQESRDRVQKLFTEVLAPLAQQLATCVVDGGTDDGVMQMMGKSRSATGGTFALIGVAPNGKVALPDASDQGTSLEPNHTHFVLIPGENWGDESPWLAQVASVLAGEQPSVTLLINGGKVALVDLAENLATGRPAIVLAGSGRLADEVAVAVRAPEQAKDEAIASILSKGPITVFDLDHPLKDLKQILYAALAPHEEPPPEFQRPA